MSSEDLRLPTATGIVPEEDHPPFQPQMTSWLWSVGNPEPEPSLAHARIPDQRNHGIINVILFKTLHLGVICCTTIDN